MAYLKKHFLWVKTLLIAISFIGLSSYLLAKPPLWEAMEAFENGEDVRAETLFRPLASGNPIVRPYLEYLHAKDLPEAEDLSNYETDKYARGWFDVSKMLRKVKELTRQMATERKSANQIKLRRKRADFLDTILMNDHVAASYANGSLAEKGIHPADENKRVETARNLYRLSFQKDITEIDIRTLLALGRLGAQIKIEGVDVSTRLPILERLLVAMDVGAATFQFARLFEMSIPGFYLRLVRSAAFHGVVEAQFKTAKEFSSSTKEAFYWFVRAAEQSHKPSQGMAAHMLEKGEGCPKDLKKSFLYSQRAVDGTADKNAQIDFNHALRFENGLGTEPNPEKAEVYFKLAVDHGGDDDMVWKYGNFLISNSKKEEAKKVLRPLAEKGHLKAIQDFAAISENPQDYADLIPICFVQAETDDEALHLVASLVCSSHSCSIDIVRLYDLLKRFEKSPNIEDRKFGYIKRATLLSYIDKEGRLSGDVIDLLRKAADCGSVEAYYEMGELYMTGRYTAPDQNMALSMFRKALAEGITLAHQKIGFLLMEQNNPEVDQDALSHFQIASRIPSNLQSYAAFNLALMHMQKRGGAVQDFALISQYLNECCAHPELRLDALYELAKCEFLQMQQDSGDRNTHIQKAFEFIEEGVQVGHAPSLFLKGQLLFTELAQDQDRQRRGLRLIEEAAKKNFDSARMIYAFLLIVGVQDVLESSPKTAMKVLSGLSLEKQQQFFDLFFNFVKKFMPTEPSGQPLTVKETEEIKEGEVAEVASQPEPKEPQASPLDPRLERLLKDFDQCAGKKQVKWRKVQKMMGTFMSLTSGGFTPGKGSGLHVKLAGAVSGLHIPHGRNATELAGGRLESMRALIEQALQGRFSQNEIAGLLEGGALVTSKDPPASATSSSQPKKKKKKKK